MSESQTHMIFGDMSAPRTTFLGGPDSTVMGAPLATLAALRLLSSETQAPSSLRYVRETGLIYAWDGTRTDDEALPGLVEPSTGDGRWVALSSSVAAYDSAPGASDDVTEGVRVGDIRIVGSAIYICIDATEGAAVWVLMGGASSSPSPVRVEDGYQILTTDRVVIVTESGQVTLPSLEDVPEGGMEVYIVARVPPVSVLATMGDVIEDADDPEATQVVLGSTGETAHICTDGTAWTMLY